MNPKRWTSYLKTDTQDKVKPTNHKPQVTKITTPSWLQQLPSLSNFGKEVWSELQNYTGVKYVFSDENKEQSHHIFQAFELANDIIVVFNSQNNVLYLNKTARELLQCADSKNLKLSELFDINSQKLISEWTDSYTGTPLRLEQFTSTVGDSVVRMEGYIQVNLWPHFYVAVLQNSSPKHQLDWSQASIAELSHLFEASSQVFFMLDDDFVVQTWNEAAQQLAIEIFGHKLQNGKKINEYFDTTILSNELKRTVKNKRERTTFQQKFITIDGDEKWIDVELIPIQNTSFRSFAGYVILLSDVTTRIQLESQLQFRANYDAVLGIPNRHFFVSHIESLVGGEVEFSVVSIDIDDFKLVNDSLGHDYGDELLAKVCSRMQKVLDQNDVLARFGGDQFTLLFHSADKAYVVDKVRQLKLLQNQPYSIHGNDVYISAGFGVLLEANEYANVSDILRDADAALYEAKAKGKGNYAVFNSALTKHNKQKLDLQTALRRAVDNEELDIYLQPIVDGQTNEVVGCESLIRWEKDGKVISPGEFLPAAEEAGLMHEIDTWMLYKSCELQSQWKKLGLDIRIAVNVSLAQITQQHFLDIVTDTLRDFDLPSSSILLELSENLVLENSATVQNLMHQLDELGVPIALDDFGTGYSSLVFLKNFPIDVLKIDQSFVRDLGSSRDSQAIVRATVDLAHTMGLEVVAEGVETQEQIEFLKNIKCDKLQGYHFCKPIPAEDFSDWISAKYSHSLPQAVEKLPHL